MTMTIRRILFPTDFSPTSQSARDYALALAEKFQAELHILNVVQDPALPAHGARFSWAISDDILPRLIQEAETQMASVVPPDELRPLDLREVRAVKIGNPVSTIINYVKEHHIDLIVIGTHGHTGFSHLLLGSVAEKLVRLATCPVFSIHAKRP